MKGHCPGLSKNVKHMGGGDDLIQSRQSFASTVGQSPALLYILTLCCLSYLAGVCFEVDSILEDEGT